MHPKEYKQVKSGTGRFTHLCLTNSEIIMGSSFNAHPRVLALVNDPENFPVLLYPCNDAINISDTGIAKNFPQGKQLVVFLIDASWILARRMFNRNHILMGLPRIMFVPEHKSRYIIKRQPHEICLSTLEATHELLLSLEKAGLDHYDRPEEMLDLFKRMQDSQLEFRKTPSMRHWKKGKGGEDGCECQDGRNSQGSKDSKDSQQNQEMILGEKPKARRLYCDKTSM